MVYLFASVLHGALAGQPQKITDVAPNADTVGVTNLVAADSKGASSRAEGIKVHGHWTIEVRNPDGTLAHRREFENALLEGGQRAIARILFGVDVPGRWEVRTSAGSLPSPCGGISVCIAAESTDPRTGTFIFKNLTKSVVPVGNVESLTLSGNVTAIADGTITTVWTANYICQSAIYKPTECAQIAPESHTTRLDITGTSISPISVITGQQILLKVILQFS